MIDVIISIIICKAKLNCIFLLKYDVIKRAELL